MQVDEAPQSTEKEERKKDIISTSVNKKLFGNVVIVDTLVAGERIMKMPAWIYSILKHITGRNSPQNMQSTC